MHEQLETGLRDFTLKSSDQFSRLHERDNNVVNIKLNYKMHISLENFMELFLQHSSIFILLFATTCILLLYQRLQENTGLPPGPFSWPIIGNLHLLGSKPHERLTELAKTFGDVYRLQLGSRRVIVLNSLDCVKEALVKKSSDFSNRPPLNTLRAFDMDGRSIAFGPYSQRYERNRRLALLALHSYMLKHEQLSSHTKECVKCLCEQFQKHNQHFDPAFDVAQGIAELNMINIFGVESVNEKRTEELRLLLKSSSEFIKNNNINNLADFLPWFTPFLQHSFDDLAGLIQKLADFVKAIYLEKKKNYINDNVVEVRCVSDALARCFESGTNERLVALGEELDLNEDTIVSLLTDIFGASVETTTATMLWAIYCLACHPNIQDRLYQELKDVVGLNCISVNDKNRLPFLEATVLETLRYSTVLPLAIPHYAERETTVGPYRIPEDTIVFVNLWAVNHDERVFKDAFKFDPGRFIDENGEVNRARFSSIPFSTGTRKCLGHLLAQLQLFLLLGGIVHKYRIELSGCPSLAPEFGFILRPQPFKINVYPRQ
ncbi:cytochrome P450 1A1-like [Dendronephthya gigantea]|uniref:cytochrome P450 1A1-like n=1 Tax=Dendronephthya gigantea TaxID=151771 RepID=UPI00106C26BB|nr:cytochrome P450 1A1-like [Dendronephthya gigantea]